MGKITPEGTPEVPAMLYYGTKEKLLNSIMQSGVKPKMRKQLQLFSDMEVARSSVKVWNAHIAVLILDGEAMREDGLLQPLGDGVWQSEGIPRKYIKTVRYFR